MTPYMFRPRPCSLIPLLLIAGMLIGLRRIIQPMAVHDLQALFRAVPLSEWQWAHTPEIKQFWIALGPEGQSYFLFIRLTVELAGQICLFSFWGTLLGYLKCRKMPVHDLDLTWAACRLYLLLIFMDKASWVLLSLQIESALVLLPGIWNSRLLLEGLLWAWVFFLVFPGQPAAR